MSISSYLYLNGPAWAGYLTQHTKFTFIRPGRHTYTITYFQAPALTHFYTIAAAVTFRFIDHYSDYNLPVPISCMEYTLNIH